MSVFKLRPARQAVPENTRVVVDLDRLACEPVGFRFQGKIHEIKPMSTARFLKACNELASIQTLIKSDSITEEQVVEAYSKLFEAVCDTITTKDLYEMTIHQRGALTQQILEIIHGKSFSEEKKSPMNPESLSAT